jgi:glycerophosphoryl diester phosphodiesterase
MAAFRKARDLGAPGIELDVHLCATGELVVAHDFTFVRTAGKGANGNGRPVEDLSWAEIQALDVGAWFGPEFQEGPPLLAEVLEEFCPGMYVDIELKSMKKRGDPLPAVLAKLLKDLGPRVEQSVTASSFNPLSLSAFKRASPDIPTAVIWSDDPAVPRILRRGLGRFIARSDYAKPDYLQVNAASHRRLTLWEGRPIVLWTVDDPALAKRLLELGCQGFITNRPQDMGAVLGRD